MSGHICTPLSYINACMHASMCGERGDVSGGLAHPVALAAGPMWPDYMANKTGWDLLNYAVGESAALPYAPRR